MASVSCIYGLGDPEAYRDLMVSLRPGMNKDRDDVIRELVEIQYERNDIDFSRGNFRVRGDILEIMTVNTDVVGLRIEFFGDEIERIVEIDHITGKIIGERNYVSIFPASHYVTSKDKLEGAIKAIEEELVEREKFYKENDMLLELQRIKQRTNYDMEMLREIGTCKGIENYSRHLTGRRAGERALTLMDFFPDDFLVIIDESHVTIPQLNAMYAGDQSRKKTLIDYGFRLPSAADNRPLKFEEFLDVANQVLFVSATPGKFEVAHSEFFAEQIIRPTGLLDPEIEVRPIENQIDDLIGEINQVVKKNERILVTTLTKKMAENLTKFMEEAGIRVRYLHSEVETLERIEIIKSLRLGEFDVLVGINLLREGLDIPEVSLVAILDADKEGFLRSETSLIQTVGRAARNSEGRVIMYADKITRSMAVAIEETNRRRNVQEEYNRKHNITPQTIIKDVRESISTLVAESEDRYSIRETMDREEIKKEIIELTKNMFIYAEKMEFENAAKVRDRIRELENKL